MRLIVVTLLALAATAAPVLAAPVMAPLKPCYVVDDRAQEVMALSGSGFTPGSIVDLLRDGVVAKEGVAVDAAGNLPFGTLTAPVLASGERDFTVGVVERGNGANSVTLTSRVAHLDVSIRPKVTRPNRFVRMRGRGFTAAKPIFLHYVRGRTSRKTVRIGAPEGICGTFDVRLRQFPFVPKAGRWTLQIDQQRRYSRSPNSATVQIDVDVVRVPKRSR